MKRIILGIIACLSLLGAAAAAGGDGIKRLHQQFASPSPDARPGVYWYFMDGNLSKEGMTKDLEAMKQAGIGSVVFLEVNIGIPRGKVDFLSDEWKSCFRHAVDECERLGITMILGIGPGWTGSGGPWVKPQESMRHIVSSSARVTGGGTQTIRLERPAPRSPYFGEGVFTPELRKIWEEYYEDVAVLAFPATEGEARITDIDEKALYYRAPYSSAPGVKQFIPRDNTSAPLLPGQAVDPGRVVDLTPLLKDGTVTWDVPEGEWTIMRFGLRNNGAVTRPAPFPGLGFECDKADTTALMVHLKVFTDELFKTLGPRDPDAEGGLKILHMDSWEMGAQNWAPALREEFTKRCGYDPQPYLPAYAGYVVGDRPTTERFLWDLRQTMQELMLENHSLAVKEYARRHGLQLSIEPYDMNPMQDLELGATADIPMCEFWSPGGFNTSFAAIEASSLANIKGQHIVPSEAFTAAGDGWRQHPASMKNQTDWALAMGINRLTFHTFQHQCLPDNLRPGMTMGPYGVHWDRNQTWWPYVGAYHDYLARCQSLMQYGTTVADILYLAPEEAPYVFRAPQSALEGDSHMPDKKGYGFDACPPSLLMTASAEDGDIVFPSGMRYRLLVLPDFGRMTPALLQKIASLVADGATVAGMPPAEAPGLTDYPKADQSVRSTALQMWGSADAPQAMACVRYGKGRIYWSRDMRLNADNLYPDYGVTASILRSMGLAEDFTSSNGGIRYIHKRSGQTDYYFVANRTDLPARVTCTFRVSGAQPHLWDPTTGQTRPLASFADNGTTTSVELDFDRHQSFFIVFEPAKGIRTRGGHNFMPTELLSTVSGPWRVSFDPAWGGPAETTFDTLTDWSANDDEGIRYYSGTASYRNTFDYAKAKGRSGRIYLNLGKVKNMARVWVNGHDLGVVWTDPWRVDITDVVRKGSNELRIDVVNLWVNRLIGDESRQYDGIADGQWPQWLTKGESRPGDRYTFTTHPHYTKDSPLMESGLMGPVTVTREVAE